MNHITFTDSVQVHVVGVGCHKIASELGGRTNFLVSETRIFAEPFVGIDAVVVDGCASSTKQHLRTLLHKR